MPVERIVVLLQGQKVHDELPSVTTDFGTRYLRNFTTYGIEAAAHIRVLLLKYCDEYVCVSVCLSVCLSVYSHIS